MTDANKKRIDTKLPRHWQVKLSRFFASVWVELSVGALVLVSVVLTLLEFAIAETASGPRDIELLTVLERTSNIITWVFAIELTLRYLGASSKRKFFRQYWLDIVAVLPLFRVFRVARAVRLLRLIRLLRLFGVMSRLASHFPYILRRGAMEYLVVCGLLALTIVFGSGAMMFFEGRSGAAPEAEGEALDLEDSFWFSLYSLFAGEPIPGPPRTIGGKIVAVFVMFMGLTIFAMLTGTVSAFMVERLQTEGVKVNWDDLRDHVIVCGWSSEAEIIIREFRAWSVGKKTPIVFVTEWERDRPSLSPDIESNVFFYNDDFCRIAALEQVGIHRASTCIILADTSGGRNEQDVDARTVLAALTVEKLNPDVYTCAELLNRSHGSHLTMGQVNDYVVSGEYGAYLLAQAAMNRGLMDVFTELLTYQKGNEFYRVKLPDRWVGTSYMDTFVELKRSYNAILVSVHTADGQMFVNPPDYEFCDGDEIVVIAEEEISL
ncbi:MAG: ion transporter [Planctomycetes bacterium]|nr:ion transporter [Planctomycetota bacterium]MBL7043077.1 ion transporter [Pirellulaceae bacterium]